MAVACSRMLLEGLSGWPDTVHGSVFGCGAVLDTQGDCGGTIL